MPGFITTGIGWNTACGTSVERKTEFSRFVWGTEHEVFHRDRFKASEYHNWVCGSKHSCFTQYKAVAGYSFSGSMAILGSGMGIAIAGGSIDSDNSTVYMKKICFGGGEGRCKMKRQTGLSRPVGFIPICDDPRPPASPLVIDLGQDNFHFGDAGVGVAFDMNGNGEKTTMQWVRYNGNEAFLVRDLNGNGMIDNGAELFGTGTVMVPHSLSSKRSVKRLSLAVGEALLLQSANVTLAPNGFVFTVNL